MWIVQVALRRPYTFIVLAFVIAIFGSLSALRTPTDIFPSINIPVVSVVWTYSGLLPKDMSDRVIYYYERQLTSQVNGIQHTESQSLNGYGVVKVFFQKDVDMGCACRKLNPGILVMQSAQDWATTNAPGAIDGARDRRIVLQ